MPTAKEDYGALRKTCHGLLILVLAKERIKMEGLRPAPQARQNLATRHLQDAGTVCRLEKKYASVNAAEAAKCRIRPR